MRKTIILYGAVLAAATFALTWLDYRFWMRDIGPEVYGLIIAVIFAALGIWIEQQRRPRPVTSPHKRNDKAIASLGLTEREVEMLGFLALGKSNKETARDLGLSPNTVKTHLANLYEKLGVNNRTQAVTKAAELAIYPLTHTGDMTELTHMGE